MSDTGPKRSGAPRLHIIDGSGYIFRAYYAIRALSTASGEPTNAVYGFTTMLEKALREERPEYIAITFDAGGQNFRKDMYTEYKATRSAPPEDLPRQIPRIHEIVDAYKLKKFVVGGVEADDVIATVARRAVREGFDVQIITGDKDLMQLVSDRISIFEPMKNVRYFAKEVEEKFGVPPLRLLDALSLCGDASDNVPGVRGVGMKTAAKLLSDWGDLEGVLAAAQAGKVKGKMGETLVAEAESARLSKRLITLVEDVPLDFELQDLRYSGPDRDQLRALFVELEFRRLIPNVSDVGAPVPLDETPGHVPETGVGDEGQKIDRTHYRLIDSGNALADLVAALSSVKRLAVAVETTTGRAIDTELIGLALAWERGQGAYIPMNHVALDLATPKPKQLTQELVLKVLKPIFEDASRAKVSAESKLVVSLFERLGIVVANLAFDSTIAGYLLEPDESNYTSALIARRHLLHEALDRQDVLGRERGKKLNFEQVAPEDAKPLAAERAEIAWRAAEVMRAPLEGAELWHVLKDVELPLVPVLGRMELAGVRIDVAQLSGMSVFFAAELERLEKLCFEAAGSEFNIGSPKQLQKVLFEDLGLKMSKRTKTGASTDASVLEVLANDHPLPQAILDYRQVQKLKSTYVDALPKMVSPATGRVHTVFSQTVAATGRLSSTDPNLQNIPIRSELGRQLRKVFVADPGHVLISIDYSQIELRVLAHFSQDPILMDAFTRGIDVHTRTAAALFEIEPSAVDREQRTQAKAVNFGVLYGMGPVRLARELKIPRRTASKFVEDYFERQKGVKQYIDDTLTFARKHGYVRTLLGRRRWIQDINSDNRGSRAQAERIATNTPIQGSAADLIKLAMIRLDARLREERLPARLILQVHDELLVEAKVDHAEQVAALVKREMENVYPLNAPLLAEGHWGLTWDEAHA